MHRLVHKGIAIRAGNKWKKARKELCTLDLYYTHVLVQWYVAISWHSTKCAYVINPLALVYEQLNGDEFIVQYYELLHSGVLG